MNVCEHIERVFGFGAAPCAPLQSTARTATRPQAVTVLMVPWMDEHGTLERMCIEAARAANGTVSGHVDTFLGLIYAERWRSESRYGKAWLRTYLAARARDPFVALGHVFSDPRQRGLIPVNHTSFDRIADVLRRL
jgi:hypothetical protein